MSLTLRVLEDRHCNRVTRKYKLGLTDMYWVQHNMEAIGLNNISEVRSTPKAASLKSLFPEASGEAVKAISRAQGKVGMMLGI